MYKIPIFKLSQPYVQRVFLCYNTLIYDQTMVTTPEGKTITLNEVTYFLSKCTQEQMKEILLSILKWFKKMVLQIHLIIIMDLNLYNV